NALAPFSYLRYRRRGKLLVNATYRPPGLLRSVPLSAPQIRPVCGRQALRLDRVNGITLKVPLQFHRVLIAEHCVLFSERLKTARFRVRLVFAKLSINKRGI